MPIGSVDWIADGMLLGPIHEFDDERFDLPVRNQFFHGAHPLGWIRDIHIQVDEIDADEVALVIRGQVVPLELIRTTSDIWWYPREVASIRFRAAGLAAGTRASVSCRFAVSTFFFTPAIDRMDRYPTMQLDLHGDLPRIRTGARA